MIQKIYIKILKKNNKINTPIFFHKKILINPINLNNNLKLLMNNKLQILLVIKKIFNPIKIIYQIITYQITIHKIIIYKIIIYNITKKKFNSKKIFIMITYKISYNKIMIIYKINYNKIMIKKLKMI